MDHNNYKYLESIVSSLYEAFYKTLFILFTKIICEYWILPIITIAEGFVDKIFTK